VKATLKRLAALTAPTLALEAWNVTREHRDRLKAAASAAAKAFPDHVRDVMAEKRSKRHREASE